MNLFPSLLSSIPRNRLDYVEDLYIPDFTLSPYEWTDPEDAYDYALRRYRASLRSDSLLYDSLTELDRATLSTDSSIPLSRALTDSDIDYGFYKRYRSLNYPSTWEHLRAATAAFPSGYLDSLYRYIPLDDEAELLRRERQYAAELASARRRFNEEWRRSMRRRFADCYVYAPDDIGLLELKNALRRIDMKALEADLATIRPL